MSGDLCGYSIVGKIEAKEASQTKRCDEGHAINEEMMLFLEQGAEISVGLFGQRRKRTITGHRICRHSGRRSRCGQGGLFGDGGQRPWCSVELRVDLLLEEGARQKIHMRTGFALPVTKKKKRSSTVIRPSTSQ